MSSKMNDLISLCKQRGFVFQSSEIYGGLRSCYDYGPLGSELKRNLMNEWWRTMIHERHDIHGLDASIIMHSSVWKASGHLDKFNDPLVDCRLCHERFRSDKVDRLEVGADAPIRCSDKGAAKKLMEHFEIEKLRYQIAFPDIKIERKGKQIFGFKVGECGYVCPHCGSPILSEERQFNLMFETQLGPLGNNPVYLRPETAQGMFVQFSNIQRTTNAKIPFGIAQIGKSFRNEITTEHFIFRSCEFEQMEMEFFVEPGSDEEWHEYWKQERLDWWRSYANDPEAFRLRDHAEDELAHYAKACADIEYAYPWGWDELEGVANRTDHDLKCHQEASGKKLEYTDSVQKKTYLPFVIEPAAGVTRGVLVYLLDALTYDEEHRDEKGRPRILLKLHPRLAPVKCAILPLVKKGGLPEVAETIFRDMRRKGINCQLDLQHSIGKRYRRHDEIGTPYAVTVDFDTLEDNCVTVRDRDTTLQERVSISEVTEFINNKLNS